MRPNRNYENKYKMDVKTGLKTVRKIAIGVIGFTIILIGIILIVLPGPAFIVIPLGLGVLALEFEWARRMLQKVKEKVARKKNSAK